jgi:signal transduction histidine kinase
MKRSGSDARNLEKLACVGEMAAAIAHDIKNSLAGINAAVQVLAEDLPDDDSIREITDGITREIQRLDGSVKDLLSYARLPEPRLVRTSVLAIIDRVARLVAPKAEELGIEIEMGPFENEAELDVDPEQMEQVFFNIMMKELQSMAEGGGKLIIKASFDRKKGTAEVSLSDTGPALPKSALERLFEPSFSSRQAGTGLGLAVTRNIVENHGGTILAKSRKGKGTTFSVVLPLAG